MSRRTRDRSRRRGGIHMQIGNINVASAYSGRDVLLGLASGTRVNSGGATYHGIIHGTDCSGLNLPLTMLSFDETSALKEADPLKLTTEMYVTHAEFVELLRNKDPSDERRAFYHVFPPRPAVPRWGDICLQFLLPHKLRKTLPGDLEEEFTAQVARMGLRMARAWYWWQVARSLVWLVPLYGILNWIMGKIGR